MWQQIFLGFAGICSGVIIAGGAVGLMIGLSILPRYAGITHTADSILLYEDMTLLGFVLGNLFWICMVSFPGYSSEAGSSRWRKSLTSSLFFPEGSV